MLIPQDKGSYTCRLKTFDIAGPQGVFLAGTEFKTEGWELHVAAPFFYLGLIMVYPFALRVNG